MTKKGLHRHYDRLSAEERFRLDVLATARGDAEESERLTRTCPRRNYIMNEAGFGGRWSGTRELGLRVYVALSSPLTKLRMIDAFREVIPYAQNLSQDFSTEAYFDGHEAGSRYAWRRASKDGDPPGYEEAIGEADENADPAIEGHLDELESKVEKYGELLPETDGAPRAQGGHRG